MTHPVTVGWVQAFNQVYPGAAQFLQNAAAYYQGAGARLPNRTSADLHRELYGTDMHPMDPGHPRWELPGSQWPDPSTTFPTRSPNPMGVATPALSRGPSSRWQLAQNPEPWALVLGIGVTGAAGAAAWVAHRNKTAWDACEPENGLVPEGWLDRYGTLTASAQNALHGAFEAVVAGTEADERWDDAGVLARAGIQRLASDPTNCQFPLMATGKLADLKKQATALAWDWRRAREGNPRVRNAGCYPGVEAAIGLDPMNYGFWPGYNYYVPPGMPHSEACRTGELMCNDPRTGQNHCRAQCLPGEQSLPIARTGDYGPPMRQHNPRRPRRSVTAAPQGAQSPPLRCPPGQRPRRSSTPPFGWECATPYVGACPTRELPSDSLQQYAPEAYEAGCRVFDPSCRLPTGWIPARRVPWPVPVGGPAPVVACPPSCTVYEDAPPTSDDPYWYCCKQPYRPDHPDCASLPGGGNAACGGRPCPPGMQPTGLRPAGWNHPEIAWWDAYQICCPKQLTLHPEPVKPPGQAPRPTGRPGGFAVRPKTRAAVRRARQKRFR